MTTESKNSRQVLETAQRISGVTLICACVCPLLGGPSGVGSIEVQGVKTRLVGSTSGHPLPTELADDEDDVLDAEDLADLAAAASDRAAGRLIDGDELRRRG